MDFVIYYLYTLTTYLQAMSIELASRGLLSLELIESTNEMIEVLTPQFRQTDLAATATDYPQLLQIMVDLGEHLNLLSAALAG